MSDWQAAFVFLPLLGSFLAHAPVIRFDLLAFLKQPVDGGATFRGRRILGDNKTWRGLLVMSAGVVAAAVLLARWPWYWAKLPPEIRSAGSLSFGVLLGAGAVLAELPGSFLKRQLDIAPGAQRRSLAGRLISVWDQGDFVVGAWIALLPIWTMTWRQAAASFVVVSAIHLAISGVGYALGIRKTVL
jgi:CDP-2,3-bis-(O-geranylgeranyl)-sn-glycerol synthase